MNELVKGLMVVIGLSIAIGKYDDLERWARKQTIEALIWRNGSLPVFTYGEVRHAGRKHKGAGSVNSFAASRKQ